MPSCDLALVRFQRGVRGGREHVHVPEKKPLVLNSTSQERPVVSFLTVLVSPSSRTICDAKRGHQQRFQRGVMESGSPCRRGCLGRTCTAKDRSARRAVSRSRPPSDSHVGHGDLVLSILRPREEPQLVLSLHDCEAERDPPPKVSFRLYGANASQAMELTSSCRVAQELGLGS